MEAVFRIFRRTICYLACRSPVDVHRFYAACCSRWLNIYGPTLENQIHKALMPFLPPWLARRCSRARMSIYARPADLSN